MKSKSNVPFINGYEYGWANVKFLIGGVPVIGITSINYSEEQELTELFGLGNQPVSRGAGNITCIGSVSLYSSTLLALQKSALAAGDSQGSISSILPFDVIVSYEQFGTGKVVTDVLHNVQFKNNERGVNSGDGAIISTINLMITHINWNVA